MRRLFPFAVTLALSSGFVAALGEPAAAATPPVLGSNVTRISHKRMNTYVNGTLVGSVRISKIGVKGNSSALFPKKPYGVVLSSNASLFGLPSGRTFRLVSNYHDRSLLRNKVSYDLAEKITSPRWSPHSVYTELFLRGRYRGSYQILEETTAARIGLPSSGLLAEFDKNGLAIDTDGMRSIAKDPVSSTRMRAMITNHVNPFLADLRSGSGWKDDINLNSFVDFYLVREFTKDNDSDFLFSNRYYTSDVGDRGANIVMGPVWDFDQSAGNEVGIKHNGVVKPTGWWVRYHDETRAARLTHLPWSKNNWYNRLVTKEAFTDALCTRWKTTRPIFADVAYGGMASAQSALGGQLVADNDRSRWGRRKVARPRSHGSWASEVAYLSNWYAQRYAWMNDHIC